MFPYIGEVRMFAGNYAPSGWMFCEGQLLPIAENDALFFLIGTTYGGDGQSTFALPDLRGRIPIHQGTGPQSARILGEAAGSEAVTLTLQQTPIHNHAVLASTDLGHLAEPQNAVLAAHRDFAVFESSTGTTMAAALTPSGGSQPHGNQPPYLCVSFIISLFGIFPTFS